MHAAWPYLVSCIQIKGSASLAGWEYKYSKEEGAYRVRKDTPGRNVAIRVYAKPDRKPGDMMTAIFERLRDFQNYMIRSSQF